jgi:hypothetical protein
MLKMRGVPVKVLERFLLEFSMMAFSAKIGELVTA